jgi:hypothetical protein
MASLGGAERLLALARELLHLAAAARHGPDFASCWWFGAYYTFTASQARAVAVLWAAWENGTPDVRQETLLESAGSESSRLDNLFRRHPAWGTMIVPGPQKGLFRLNEEPASENHQQSHSPAPDGAPPSG